jgi:hypothetical protein
MRHTSRVVSPLDVDFLVNIYLATLKSPDTEDPTTVRKYIEDSIKNALIPGKWCYMFIVEATNCECEEECFCPRNERVAFSQWHIHRKGIQIYVFKSSLSHTNIAIR